MKKSIIVSPEDCRSTDWVKKAADAGFDTLALHSGGRRHDLLEALAEFRTPEFRARCAGAGASKGSPSSASGAGAEAVPSGFALARS